MRDIHRSIGFAATALVALVATADAQEGRNSEPDETPRAVIGQQRDIKDVEFLLEALRTSIAEAEIGELAQHRAANAAVRDYGERIRDDHARSVEEIKTMLMPLAVTIPSEPTVKAQGHRAALAELSGRDFDTEFLRLMIASHTEAIEAYGAQTHANPNKQLSAFAERTLPILREHLEIAATLQNSE
jgi:putative membrane protein